MYQATSVLSHVSRLLGAKYLLITYWFGDTIDEDLVYSSSFLGLMLRASRFSCRTAADAAKLYSKT